MCYPVCGMVHIKDPLLLIRKSSPCGGSGFPLLLSEWSFTICLMLYNRKYNVLSVSLNKTFPFHLPRKWVASAITDRYIQSTLTYENQTSCLCLILYIKYLLLL